MEFLISKEDLDKRKSNEDFLLSWKRDLSLFVHECLRVDGRKDSTGSCIEIRPHQKEYCDLLSNLRYAKDVPAEYRTEEEVALARKHGISIMSGRGNGKDAVLSWSIIWFQALFKNCKNLATSANFSSLKSVLWSEISKWMYRRDMDGNYIVSDFVRDSIELQNKRIFHKTGSDDEGNVWFTEARTINNTGGKDSQAETFSGRHEHYQLYIVDEASGVPDPVYIPIVGGMTGGCNIALLAFNPTRMTGFALRTHLKDEQDMWLKLRWNSEECGLVPQEKIEAMRAEYGYESNFYRVSVLGLPPRSEEGTLIPHEWAERCVLRASDGPSRERRVRESVKGLPIVLGMDSSGEGACKSVIVARQGGLVLGVHKFDQIGTMEQASWLLSKIRDYDARWACIEIDGGYGATVYELASKYSDKLQKVMVSAAASYGAKFSRLREELWWKMRTKIEHGLLFLPDDDDLVMEISGPKLRPEGDSRGRVKMETKQEMRARGIKSPDLADALMLTFYVDNSMFEMELDIEPEKKDRWADMFNVNKYSYVSHQSNLDRPWMSV